MTGPRDFDVANTSRVHEQFLSGRPLAELAPGSLRSVVADSWLRSAAAGVDADSVAPPITLERSSLADYRDEHPLSRVFPLLYDVLGRAAEDCDSLMAVADEQGQLLWVCGQPGVLRRAEEILFVEGARWDEDHAGTNAPGTALRLDAPVTIHASEHFARSVQPWSCAAAPIHDPVTSAILGIVDVTGGPDMATVQTIAMVRAAARMAESELARINAVEGMRLDPRTISDGGAQLASYRRSPSYANHADGFARRSAVRLEALGRPDCVATIGSRSVRLSPRHSEIAVILSCNPDGLTGDQLAIELYPADVTSSTLRAELVRLRGLLGQQVLGSRPYRLTGDVDSDWSAVAGHLAAGNLTEALRMYRGPLLPQSDAPGVVAHREELERRLRAALLASDRAELMVAWTRARWGAQDLDMWRRQLQVLPLGSPLRPLAAAEVARLDAEYRR
ncbi:GAF domain-containing protein [Jatrophihabitans telluris]|uniref:GAF domain-containing protein n=1 Tax=Jatrophihabitans telluris TaxID=2038343 RepID=A0ABY4QXK9_9ACTN|nr:GAF domain-containing protein [Jatrophihabitans telluris]UQX87571.1 GAF domain-containing protein [Jatrophihabitans telluris]